MKYKTLLYIFLCVYIWFQIGDNMEIQYGKVNTVTTNQNNQLGPCSDTSIRSGFDCDSVGTTYNDANCRFVKKTGDDTTGLFGHEFTTIEGAVAQAITDGKTNVAVLDSEVYEEVITSEIPASFKIVAGDGKTPTIEWEFNFTVYVGLAISGGQVLEGKSDGIIYTSIGVGGVFLSTDYGINWSDVSIPAIANNFYNALSIDGRIILSTSANGIYTTDNNGTNYTQRLVTNLSNIKIDSNGVLYGFPKVASTLIYKSVDNGTNWTSATINGLSIGRIMCGTGMNGRLFMITSNVLYYSDDQGINWNPTTLNVGNNLILTDNNIMYATGNMKLYKSFDNGINWENITSNLPINNYILDGDLISVGNRLYIALSDSAGSISDYYFSDNDGITWSSMGFTDARILGIVFNRIFFISFFTILNIIPQLNNTLDVNGFYLDGNNKQALGIASGTGAQTGLTVKYCELSDYYYKAVDEVADLTEQYCLTHDGQYGNGDIDNIDIQDSIFYDIEERAIETADDTPTVEHCTFNNCGKGAYLTAPTMGAYTLKNNIFNNCGVDVQAVDSNGVILSYSLSNGTLINCTIDSNSKRNMIPLFLNEIGYDFRLQHKLAGYFMDTPAYLLADDSRDAGAWDYTYILNSTEWKEVELSDDQYSLEDEMVFIDPQEKTTLDGSLKTFSRDDLTQYTITIKECSNSQVLHQLKALSRDKNIKKLYPVGQGKWSITASTPGDVYIRYNASKKFYECVMPSTSMPDTDDSLAGLFLVCGSNPIGYVGYPTNLMFKIIEKTNSTTLLLEKVYEDFVGTTQWDTDIDIWKALWLGGIQYKGSETVDNKTVYKFDYSVGNIDYQPLQTNQCRGYYLRMNLGSTYYYFRCYSNDDQYIWCDDVFDESGNLVVDDYYMALIDLIFVKQKLENIKAQQKINNGTWKDGGEWFATNHTIQNNTGQINTITSNWNNEAIKVIETKEFDKDGI